MAVSSKLPVFFSSEQTHTFPMVLLVPTWVVTGPRKPPSPKEDDLLPCAIGITTVLPKYGEDVCDICESPAFAWDENKNAYCFSHLLPGGDQYALTTPAFCEFVEYDESAPPSATAPHKTEIAGALDLLEQAKALLLSR